MTFSSAKAGSVFGDVRGVTLNALGVPLPRVHVSVHSVKDNTDRNIVSNNHGTYVVENLRPGNIKCGRSKKDGQLLGDHGRPGATTGSAG